MSNVNLEFLKSALCKESPVTRTADLLQWIRWRNEETQVSVNPIPFNKLLQWHIDSKTGNIHHQSGKFFSIEGVSVTTNVGAVKKWSQPIINQPEIGYLGFLVKKIEGIYHFLVQAKIEPGNVNNVQLSPTIQATRSNYTQAHHGKSPAYLEYFKEHKGAILLDQLQSEQGARFFRKRNRNIIIEVYDDVPMFDDFKWATLGQLKELLKMDNMVNMDTRTVISGIHYGAYSQDVAQLFKIFSLPQLSSFQRDLFYSYIDKDSSIHSLGELISWLTELKSKYELQVNLIPLNNVENWERDDSRIFHKDRRYFEVIAVDVHISSREVSEWTQPIVKPCQGGMVAFVAKKINGAIHFLVQAKLEAGDLDIVELAPTVQCITGDYRKGANEYEVPFLDYVLNARKEQIQYDVMLSEEGGRIYRNQNRNMIIIADEDFPTEVPENYRWLTLYQMMEFVRYNNFLNVETRSLLSVISF